jgi:hypothetical protein
VRSSGALRGTVGEGLRKRVCAAPPLLAAGAPLLVPDLGICEGLAERAGLGAGSGLLLPPAWLLVRRRGMRVAELARSACAGDGLQSAPADFLSSASKDFLRSAEEGLRSLLAEEGRLLGLAGGCPGGGGDGAALLPPPPPLLAGGVGDGARGPMAPAADFLIAAVLKCASGSNSMLLRRAAGPAALGPHPSRRRWAGRRRTSCRARRREGAAARSCARRLPGARRGLLWSLPCNASGSSSRGGLASCLRPGAGAAGRGSCVRRRSRRGGPFPRGVRLTHRSHSEAVTRLGSWARGAALRQPGRDRDRACTDQAARLPGGCRAASTQSALATQRPRALPPGAVRWLLDAGPTDCAATEARVARHRSEEREIGKESGGGSPSCSDR